MDDRRHGDRRRSSRRARHRHRRRRRRCRPGPPVRRRPDHRRRRCAGAPGPGRHPRPRLVPPVPRRPPRLAVRGRGVRRLHAELCRRRRRRRGVPGRSLRLARDDPQRHHVLRRSRHRLRPDRRRRGRHRGGHPRRARRPLHDGPARRLQPGRRPTSTTRSVVSRAPQNLDQAAARIGGELWRNDDPANLVTGHVALRGLGTASPDLLVLAKQVADEHHAVLNMHQSYSPADHAADAHKFGCDPLVGSRPPRHPRRATVARPRQLPHRRRGRARHRQRRRYVVGARGVDGVGPPQRAADAARRGVAGRRPGLVRVGLGQLVECVRRLPTGEPRRARVARRARRPDGTDECRCPPDRDHRRRQGDRTRRSDRVARGRQARRRGDPHPPTAWNSCRGRRSSATSCTRRAPSRSTP